MGLATSAAKQENEHCNNLNNNAQQQKISVGLVTFAAPGILLPVAYSPFRDSLHSLSGEFD